MAQSFPWKRFWCRRAEPHWYAIALLFLYGPSVWAGYAVLKMAIYTHI